MGSVGIYVNQNGISIHDVYDAETLADGSSYWTVNEEGMDPSDDCFELKSGSLTGEVHDARDVDWERTRPRIEGHHWDYLFPDRIRDRKLSVLNGNVSRLFDAWFKAKGAWQRAARIKLNAAELELLEFHIGYVSKPRRTGTIALGMYGSS